MDHVTHVDVVVIGVGIIGASSAYYFAVVGHSVTVLEARSGYAEGSSGRSFALVRFQWADDLSIDLSWNSIRAYQRFQEQHGIDVGYRSTGYLLLWAENVWVRQFEAVDFQWKHGVSVEVLDATGAQRFLPFETVGIAGATYGLQDGRIDPHIAMGAYLGLVWAKGAMVHLSSVVIGIEQGIEGIWVVRISSRMVRVQYVVNAVGGWSAETAVLAGISVLVVHSKRNVYASAFGVVDWVVLMICDMAMGVYLCFDGDRFLFGLSNLCQSDGYDTEVDWVWLENLFGIVSEWFPWLVDFPLDSWACWVGIYENTLDAKLLIGFEPSAFGWIHACGFFGHGVMQVFEVGRLVAEQVIDGVIISLDLILMSFQCFVGGIRGLDMVI